MKKSAIEDLLRPEHRSSPDAARDDVVVAGRLIDVVDGGLPLVDFPGNAVGSPVAAGTTRRYRLAEVGCEVALMFLDGQRSRPVILGPLVRPADTATISSASTESMSAATSVDGEVTTITAGRQIVLRCGAASITLTRAGKVLIRGKYLLSRSSGVNRIKGGSIQLN